SYPWLHKDQVCDLRHSSNKNSLERTAPPSRHPNCDDLRMLAFARSSSLAVRTLLAVLGGALSIARGQAQSQTSVTPRFEVASIRSSKTDERMNYGVRGDRMFGSNMPALGWIEIAYQVRAFQVNGPAWISQEKFDIEAKAGGPGEPMREML